MSSPRAFRIPVPVPSTGSFRLLLFFLSGSVFGLLFDQKTLTVPSFWIIFPALLPFFLLKPVSLRRALAEGMAFGLAANLIGIRWLLVSMGDYGHLPLPLSLGGLLLFSLYLALFPAFFRMGTLLLPLWKEGKATLAPQAILLAPALWILSEAGRTEILTGFPWNPLGSLLFGHPDLALPARLVGTTGLSFLVAEGSLLLAYALEGISSIPSRGKASAGKRVLLLLSFFILWNLVGHRLFVETKKERQDQIRVALVQGNIPPDQKWSAEHLKADIAIYRSLSQQGIARGAHTLIWPETALPVFYNSSHPVLTQDLVSLLSPDSVLVTGSIGEIPDPDQPMGVSFTNAAVLFGPDGKVRADYVKQHLVPFGEFLPLPEIFGWLRPLIGVAGDMARGNQPGRFNLPGGFSLSPMICYEALYPSLVREDLGTSRLLGVISDDAWFGDTSAPYQLFRESAMRALENGVPMLRAANTGLSGVVLPDGTVLLRGPLFKPALLEGTVPVPRQGTGDLTLYRRHGEWVLKLSLMGVLFWWGLFSLKKRQESPTSDDIPHFSFDRD